MKNEIKNKKNVLSNPLHLLTDLIFHFVSENGENSIDINEDVKQYLNHFFDKLCNDYDTKPDSIGLIGEVSTLTNIIGRLVQDYEKYKDLNDDFTAI